jgi:hypothetical protein
MEYQVMINFRKSNKNSPDSEILPSWPSALSIHEEYIAVNSLQFFPGNCSNLKEMLFHSSYGVWWFVLDTLSFIFPKNQSHSGLH